MKRILLFVFVLLACIGFASAANCGGATQCNCGDTLVEDHVMWYDITGCYSTDGIIIGNDGITLNCNGHLIDGGSPPGNLISGIGLYNKENVLIRDCEISHFAFGIYLWGSSYNTIFNNQIIDNDADTMPTAIYIDGGSHYNQIIDNNITPVYSPWGIYMLGNYNNFTGNSVGNPAEDSRTGLNVGGSYNTFWNNTFRDNVVEYSFNNSWNLGEIGNYWHDFDSNPGYPYYYEVPGDGDGIDWWPVGGANSDLDGDGVLNNEDNCMNDYNPDQNDTDSDDVGDVCDNCVEDYNPGQEDGDSDTVGDVCDNCPVLYNKFQWDFDEDNVGDWCDNCIIEPNPNQVDSNNNEKGDACEGVGYRCASFVKAFLGNLTEFEPL